MASIECERNDKIAQLSLKKKARLDEVIRRAELSLESDEVFNQCRAIVAEKECHVGKAVEAKLQLHAVSGVLENKTKGTLTMYMQHQYEGYIAIHYTNPLCSGKTASFSMAGTSYKGVEAAVVYSGKNDRGDADCGWLTGFLVTDDGTVKVYVVCGPIKGFNNLDWADVKYNIEISGPGGYYHDETTGTAIYATIARGTNDNYSVSATFYGEQ